MVKGEKVGTMQNISRRGFSQVVAAGAAMASAGAFAVVASAEEVAAASQDAVYDVVVIGAGTGGLSAACRLAEAGKKVALLEASSWVGGASRFVGGVDSSGSMHILGTGSWDVYNETAYTYRIVEPEMGKAVVDTFYGDYVTWLESCELPLHRGEGDGYNQDWKLGWGDEVGKAGNVAFFDGFKEYADSVGVNLFFNTFGKSLMQDETGRIMGVRAALEDGTVQDFFAENVILASGGFQCNKGLTARFLGHGGDALVNVGTPYSTGTGLLMAEAVGAQLAGVFDQVSLCILPYRQDAIASENVALFNEMMKQDPEDCYMDITVFPCPTSLNSVVIDLDGNQTDVNNLLDVKRMRAFAISDQAARDAYNVDPPPCMRLPTITTSRSRPLTARSSKERLPKSSHGRYAERST